MPTTFPAPSRKQWEKYENSPMAEQQKFIKGYKDEFKRVPIDGLGSIRAGDHLVRPAGKGYEHHMLCTGFSGEQEVNIIEYTGPALGIKASSKSVSFKDVTGKGKIAENEYSVEDLVKDKIEKMIWPDKLKRFPVEEVISRARTRIDENRYDFLKNNCEHFVTWSMCGLKVSLQVKSWYIWLREVVYSAFAGTYYFVRNIASEKAVIPRIIKVVAYISDKFARIFSRHVHLLGFAIAFLMEVCLAFYEIKKARHDHSQTSEEYIAKRFDVLVKAGCRLFFGTGGALVGGRFYGAIGRLLIGALGAGLGHIIAVVITWLCVLYAWLKQNHAFPENTHIFDPFDRSLRRIIFFGHHSRNGNSI